MSLRVLHWFRRDFRVRDNAGLFAAATEARGAGGEVAGVFVFDPRWWEAPAGKLSAFQAKFWIESLRELHAALGARGIPLTFSTSTTPADAVIDHARRIGAGVITYNKDYEPAQIA